MSRNLIRMLMAVVVLNALVVAATMVLPDTANSTASQVSVARGDFDYVFAAVTVPPRRDAPATTMVDFDQAFTSVSTPSRVNTPPNRERLRNIGWSRILAPNQVER